MSVKSFIANLFSNATELPDNQHEKTKVEDAIVKNNSYRTILNPNIDNSIVKFHGASIKYPNSTLSSDDYVETELGVFLAPTFVRTSKGVDTCGVFTEKNSEKSYSFYFRVEGATILMKNFNHGGYVYPLLFVYNQEEEKYESLYLRARDEISIKNLRKPIFILRAETGFYYVDARSDYKMFKFCDNDYYANTMDLSDDGSKLFIRYGKSTAGGGASIGGTSAVMSSESRTFDVSNGVLKLINHNKVDLKRQRNVQPDLPKRVHYYFSLNNKTATQVAFKYVKENLSYRILPNEFEDDDSVNIDVTIDVKDKSSMDFFRFIYQKGLIGYAIYGISVIGILNVGMETFEFNRYLADKTPPDLKGACKDILNKISEKYNFDEDNAGQFLWENYCPYELVDSHFYGVEPSTYYGKSRDVFNEIKSDMVDSGELNTKWKSETELYRLIRTVFDHAIYQYRDPDILGLQSFDVFVPEEKLAFEYQGIQHYQPVEMFGGEEGFEYRQRLDEDKRNKCKNNCITLVEWKYDEPISQVILKRKLKEVGIRDHK